jgi:DNA topoisomerase-3
MPRGTGLSAKYNISSELAAITGQGPISRPDIMKRVWAYIKKHSLQGSSDKRMITPDAKLAEVIGKAPLNMLKLAGKLNAHIKDKVK